MRRPTVNPATVDQRPEPSQGGAMKKAYLDHDIVSAIVKDDNAAESDALDLLLAAYMDRKIIHGEQMKNSVTTD
jgi:hypothetical protein